FCLYTHEPLVGEIAQVFLETFCIALIQVFPQRFGGNSAEYSHVPKHGGLIGIQMIVSSAMRISGSAVLRPTLALALLWDPFSGLLCASRGSQRIVML